MSLLGRPILRPCLFEYLLLTKSLDRPTGKPKQYTFSLRERDSDRESHGACDSAPWWIDCDAVIEEALFTDARVQTHPSLQLLRSVSPRSKGSKISNLMAQSANHNADIFFTMEQFSCSSIWVYQPEDELTRSAGFLAPVFTTSQLPNST